MPTYALLGKPVLCVATVVETVVFSIIVKLVFFCLKPAALTLLASLAEEST